MSYPDGQGSPDVDPPLAQPRSQSFVYPVRSLLGPVQPSRSLDILEQLTSPPLISPTRVDSQVTESSYFIQARNFQPAAHSEITRPLTAPASFQRGENFAFRHYPGEEGDKSFAASEFSPLSRSDVFEPPSNNTDMLAYNIEGDQHPGNVFEEQSDPSPFSKKLATSSDGLISAVESPTKSGSSNMADDEGQSSGDVDFAASGLVHLPPFRPQPDGKPYRSRPRGRSGSNNRSTTSSQVSSLPPKPEGPPPVVGADSARSSSFSVVSQSTRNSEGPLVTIRFEHQEDENGHHVLLGREGKLAKCEDEPIRIPGTVQGFGVLMVLHENRNVGSLPVRQVSENSGVILGLSPKFLFSLDCFTSTLPPSQADLLWDSVQFLSNPDSDDDDLDEGPQVFLLSGWGEEDSAPASMTRDSARRRQWTCWVAAHRIQRKPSPSEESPKRLIVLEFELETDPFNPLYPMPSTMSGSDESSSVATPAATSGSSTDKTERLMAQSTSGTTSDANTTPGATNRTNLSMTESRDAVPKPGLSGEVTWIPSAEAILDSTTSKSKPLKALERMRRFSRAGQGLQRGLSQAHRPGGHGIGTMDVFTVLQQVNEQLGKALDLKELLEIVVGIVKDLTQFHRVLCYQFDDAWNGQAVTELVDWSKTHDLYKGLHFPASDIPAQARELYTINRVRLLYDRAQITARLVVKDRTDLDPPLDMTHCFLRAMSPIHIKYLGNMGVRASMSISIVAFQKLWGLIACHSYGDNGMRVSFPVRQMLRLISDSVSRNVERLSYAQRLRTRKLISTVPTDQHPTGYIVSNSDDLLSLFDADSGVLVIGEGAKILGPNEHGQDILLLAEYLRVKQFTLLQVSQSVTQDYPDLQLPSGLDVISGILYVPLSPSGQDFIALLRKGQAKDVHWAGKPFKEPGSESSASLEPRKSFKIWTEQLTGRCRAWTDEQLDTAAVLALIYGKFIEVWRQKESAVQTNQMTSLLLSNASHEVRTPLHQIINYLELALERNGSSLDEETRENLTRSHAASKALLFTINDLLDLTRLEAGRETSFNEPFDLHTALRDAVRAYKIEASRRNLDFHMDFGNSPRLVRGDSRKIKTVVANLMSNAVKNTQNGTVSVSAHTFEEPEGLRGQGTVAVEIVVSDTGCGIQPEKLESIFRQFEQVDNTDPEQTQARTGLGLGLAVVARVVEQLGGQLRVDSKIGEGSRFSFLLPLPVVERLSPVDHRASSADEGSGASAVSEIDSLVEAISASHMVPNKPMTGSSPLRRPKARKIRPATEGKFDVEDSNFPVRSLKVDEFNIELPSAAGFFPRSIGGRGIRVGSRPLKQMLQKVTKLRVLVVEDDPINSRVLNKRLTADGHTVASVVNGQLAVDLIEVDRDFDCILMDIQMPILDGFGATQAIRVIETTKPIDKSPRYSTMLHGRIPIFAVSASLVEDQRDEMVQLGMDGWILKPVEFKRMAILLGGISNPTLRSDNAYHEGYNWEIGGWLQPPSPSAFQSSEDPSPGSEQRSTPSEHNNPEATN